MITIRKMKSTDIEQVYDIETDVHITPWSKDILKDCLLIGYDCRVLELKQNDSVMLAGYIIVRHGLDSCHILNLCITKSLQAHGYGRQLLEFFLKSLTTRPTISSILLEVRQSNIPALNLYHSLGFERYELKKGYYVDADNSEDAIVLRKMLHQ